LIVTSDEYLRTHLDTRQTSTRTVKSCICTALSITHAHTHTHGAILPMHHTAPSSRVFAAGRHSIAIQSSRDVCLKSLSQHEWAMKKAIKCIKTTVHNKLTFLCCVRIISLSVSLLDINY